MRIVIVGMGYVGCVTAAVFAREGHHVTGVDSNAQKVAMIEDGMSPVLEPGLPELVAEARTDERLRATADLGAAMADADIVFICVGTPSAESGALRSDHVERVAEEIGTALRSTDRTPTIVLRSTVIPQVIEGMIVPAIERRAGSRTGERFGFAVNPEFLREGQSIRDFYEPALTIVGTDDSRAETTLRELYAFLTAPLVVTDRRTAALVKYASNAFHALKVTFANEIGDISRAAGADGREVMRLFCQDRKLNLSEAYLRPGMPFGGSCLPKDVRALVHYARHQDVSASVLGAVLESNRLCTDAFVRRILATGKRRVGVFGMAFKAGTDDVRESPIVAIIEGLLGKGLSVAVYDSRVSLAKLIGANRDFLAEHVPHMANLLRPRLADVLAESEILVIGSAEPEFAQVAELARPEQIVMDLVGLGGAERGPRTARVG
ncbi:MAG: nucleotide sugar dehydrogenase [Candidatus Binatia bacterium]